MLNLQSIDLKKEIQELQKNDPGKERGTDIKFLVKYIRLKKGEQGFQKVKAKLEKCGYKLPDITKIDDMEWIPSSLPTIFMVASAKVFHWEEKEIIEWGKNAAAFHAVMRFFIKYFVSLRQTLKKMSQNWRKNYSFGDIEITECDNKKKKIVARLKNFKKHPITCIYLQGTFSKIVEISTGSQDVKAEETKCMFRGDPYHEFVFNWE